MRNCQALAASATDAEGPGGTCSGAGRRWRGLAGKRNNTPHQTSATTRRRCEGHRRGLPRCRWAAAGNGRANHSQRPGTTDVKGAGGTGGPGCGARGRWRGLAGLRDDAPSHTSATQPHWCEGRRRDRRAWLRCPWAGRHPRAHQAARPNNTPHGARNTRGATRNTAQHRGAGPQARAPSATTQILRSTCVPCRSARAARRWRRSSRSPRPRRRAGPRR